MQIDRHLDAVRGQLALAAEGGGPEAVELAERLTAQLDSALRLMVLDVLADATAEITRDLAPGSVDVRLRGREPQFVVTAPTAPDAPASDARPSEPSGSDAPPVSGQGEVARINLRLPEDLKARVEQAADREGTSINTWLVRAAANAVDRGASGRQAPSAPSSQRFSGWGR